MMVIMHKFLLMLRWNCYFCDRLAVNSIVNFGNVHITAIMLPDYRHKYVANELYSIIISTSNILIDEYMSLQDDHNSILLRLAPK